MLKMSGGVTMEYTVSQLAKLSGVSGRTLRYYDQIGLLKPAKINASGYRIYRQKEVDLLQQILFFRELGVRLDDIKGMVHDPTFNQTTALKQHYNHLIEERTRLDKMIRTLEKTIASKERGIPMLDSEKFAGLKKQLIAKNEQKYGKEVRKKYGDDQVEASNEKIMGMSQVDYHHWTVLGEDIKKLLPIAYESNDPTSEIAQQLAKKHKDWLMYTWPNYSKQAHANLADMYVADERFALYYDKVIAGGAEFLRDAIKHFLHVNE